MLSTLFLGCVLTACATGPKAQRPISTRPALVAYLVRHAEKVDASADASLSEPGRARATALAHTLSSAGIQHVHSSDFARTRDTAGPTASMLDLELELYDPRDLPALAERLRKSGGSHLVVGHSNTTPALAALLGGEPGPPIDEANEYDRLYIITLFQDGTASGVLLRYGAHHPNQRR